MATIREIARLTGLSVGTVSNVLNDVDTVSKENRVKVLEAIKELNYTPSRIARSLSKKSTKNVAFIIPDITNPFFPEVVRGAQDLLAKKGYYVFLCNSDNDPEKEESYIYDLISMWVDGIIIAPSDSDYRNLDVFSRITSPLIIVDREVEELKRDLVIVNNKKGSYEMVNFLIGNGHKKIVALMGPEHVRTAQKRHEGWEKAMSENGLFSDDLVDWGSFSIDSGYEMARKMLDNVGGFDAIFAGNDLIAIGAIQLLEEKGFRVPDDISVAGFDDIYISRFMKPPLTTVRQPIYRIGEIAAELLLERMSSTEQPEPKRIIVDGELVIRDSVRKKH
ncbi:MAG: LacI family transcriptional regulator [Actinobacteria bacterium]|nr:LacI family transcriptional regulator [Actinomycetota bacterium]